MKALAANKEDVTVAQVMAQADSSKISKILEGKKDQSLDGRPQKQSMGVNAIWLMFKVYSPLCPRPPGAIKRPQRSPVFSIEKRFSIALLYGRAGRLTALFGGFRPGQRRTSRYIQI